VATVGRQIVGDGRAGLGPSVQLNSGLDLLAEIVVGNADHGDVEHGRMHDQHVLDLSGTDRWRPEPLADSRRYM